LPALTGWSSKTQMLHGGFALHADYRLRLSRSRQFVAVQSMAAFGDPCRAGQGRHGGQGSQVTNLVSTRDTLGVDLIDGLAAVTDPASQSLSSQQHAP